MQRSAQFGSRRTRVLVLATIAMLVVGLTASLAAAASPVVSGPVPPGSGAILPANLNGFDLAQVGYEQSEFFLDGTASAYIPAPTTTLTSDGNWSVIPATPS